MRFFNTGNSSVGSAVISGHNERKEIIKQLLVYFQANTFFHDQHTVNKFCVRVLGAIEQQLVHILYFNGIILFEKIGVRGQGWQSSLPPRPCLLPAYPRQFPTSLQ
jgi:hypothetical protein